MNKEKSLAKQRDLYNPVFNLACMKLSTGNSGVVWAKQVFLMAGFREEVFHKALEMEGFTVSKHLTEEDKRRIISTVLNLASEARVDDAGYKWTHPQLGCGILRRTGEVVGKAFAFQLPKNKLLLIDGDGEVMTDPMDVRLLIVRQGRTDGHLKKADVVGFWSNYLTNPIVLRSNAVNVFNLL